MSYDLLISRIKERLDALKLSERKACIMADVGLNAIRHIRVRGHAPKAETLAKLADVLGVPAAYFLEAAAEGGRNNDLRPKAAGMMPIPIEAVYVKGFVQAGAWQEALEWPAIDWKAVYAPSDSRYPGMERFALEVRGTSMDRVYPEGSVVIAIKLADLGREPQSGEHVIVLCRAESSGSMEATIKKYQVDSAGRHILWPESNDPFHQTPVVLNDIAQTRAGDGLDADHACCLDLEIYAVVIGSYRPE